MARVVAAANLAQGELVVNRSVSQGAATSANGAADAPAGVLSCPAPRAPTVRPPRLTDGVEEAAAALAKGAMIVVVDEPGSAVLAIAAEHVDPGALASMGRHAGGWVFLALTSERCAELGLVPDGYRRASDRSLARIERKVTATISAVELVAIRGSVPDQAHTIRVAADPSTGRDAIVTPGRVQPVCVYEGGVRDYPGRAEAAVDLARLAGLPPAVAVCEIIDQHGGWPSSDQIQEMARTLGLVTVSVQEVLDHRRLHEALVERVVSATLPTSFGRFDVVGYRSRIDDSEHLAIVAGDVADGDDVPVHLHTRCLTGDVFHSLRCDCANRLEAALATINREGRGVVVYWAPDSGHEDPSSPSARSEAQVTLLAGWPPPPSRLDAYEVTAAIIKDLKVSSVALGTSDPLQIECLRSYGVPVGPTDSP